MTPHWHLSVQQSQPVERQGDSGLIRRNQRVAGFVLPGSGKVEDSRGVESPCEICQAEPDAAVPVLEVEADLGAEKRFGPRLRRAVVDAGVAGGLAY